MQLGWPARTNNGHPGSCDEAGIHDPRARAALLLLLRPCAEARRWLVRKARAKPRNDLHVRAGGAETQDARGFFRPRASFCLYRKSPEPARIRAVLFDPLAKNLRLRLIFPRKD